MLFLGGVLPIAGGFFLTISFAEWRWVHYPAHATVEGLGAFAAIVIATTILIMQTYEKLPPIYLWVATGLLGMGILDGFHAVLHAGKSFVWLHSLATFVGGMFFTLVWLPKNAFPYKYSSTLAVIVSAGAVLIGVISLSDPSIIPTMVASKEFTLAARGLNAIGGIGFLLAAIYFIVGKSIKTSDERTVFSTHAFLFGIAGLLFELSELWDAAWWLWHVLRLIAYLVAVYFFLSLYHREERALQQAHDNLELKVYERTGELREEIVERKRVEELLQEANDNLEEKVLQRTSDLNKEITERKRLQDDLKNTVVKLTHSNEELEQFAYVASHDLQEPLRKVQAFGDMLEEEAGENLSENAQLYLGYMQDAARRMQTLIQDLLAFSRVISKANPFVKVDVNEILHEVIDDLEIRIKETGGRVEFSQLPMIEGDPSQIKHIFQNLLENSLKYHRDGTPPVVEVYADQGSGGNGKCRIHVKDEGIGFEEEYSKRIFRLFERLHVRENFEGTGIGLAICEKIVRRHNGSITADSQPGEGSTFTVELPLKQES